MASSVNQLPNNMVDFKEALDIAGAGKYQMFHGALMLASLSGAMLEMTGYGYILPAAACDLQLSTATRGLIASILHLGVVLTDAFWGSLTDSRGRKPILLLSCAVSGLIGLTSAFMPDLTLFAVCKLIGSLFLSCPSGLGFAYACELTPRRRRDITVLLCNGLLMLSTVYSILFSWGIMRTGWHLDVGVLNIRPWRILTALHALPLILSAKWMTQAKESPKFLMVKGKEQEAIDVLRHIYNFNTGLPADSYPVMSLRNTLEDLEEIRKGKECDGSLSSKIMNNTLVQLLRPPHLKWLALIGFLTFGMFSTLVGLSVFAPDITSKAMSVPAGADETICVLINQIKNVTEPTTCKDNLTNSTFVIVLISCILYGSFITVIGLTPMSKRYQLIGTYLLVATACLTSGLLRRTHIAVWFIWASAR